MSIPYEATGRTGQKRRTREALISATRSLIAEGLTPTVEEAAARAEISRTTAYRYFPNTRALLLAAHPEIDRQSLLGDDPPTDPAERLSRVLDEFIRITLESEAQLRMTLRLSLEPGSAAREAPLRRGRAIGWIEEALAVPLVRLPEAEGRRLVYAIRTAVGIEALIWLVDVAKVSRDEAARTMKWAGMGLLKCVSW